MIKIALIGEDPTDTNAIKELMHQRFAREKYSFFSLSDNQRGTKMLNAAAIRTYNDFIEKKKPQHVIVIMDADAILPEKEKIKEKLDKYEEKRKEINCSSILLLNIYELEALILADIESFNAYFGSKVKVRGSVSHQKEPKEFLKSETLQKYRENRCPEIFRNLKFDSVMRNCDYFREFVKHFERTVGATG